MIWTRALENLSSDHRGTRQVYLSEHAPKNVLLDTSVIQPFKMGPMIEKRSNLIQKNDEILCHPTIMVLGTDYPNYQSTGDLLSAIAINNLI